ncbi:MAG: FAD-binding protein [Pseudomonadota bacterium]
MSLPPRVCADFADGVLVLGAGIAGLCAALAAAPRRVLVLCPDEPGRSSSSWLAQGGIAAPIGPADSVDIHVGDTLNVAGHAADPVAAARVISGASEAIDFLVAAGVPFDRQDGAWSLHLEAGHRRARVAHALGDRSGAAIVAALWDQVRIAPHVTVRCGWQAVTLATDAAGSVVGVHALDAAGEPALILAAETVLATGGAGRMFRYTTNGPWAAGDGLAMALVAGARTAALEFVQFHPTALRVDTDPLPLLTEALRGAGARLVTDSGDLLMAGRHPLGDLAPRDVVARAVWECAQTGAEVLLDATRVFSSPAGTAFPGARATSLAHGIDPASTYLPVTAAAHYHMGGVVVDDEGRTTVPGLWACGEVSYTGLHGANRLASNSLLEAVVCGRSAGAALARRPIEPRGPAVAFIPVATTEVEAAPLWHALRVRMWEAMGPVRDGASLYAAITATRAALQSLPENEHVLRQRHELALTMMQAALAREESRGAHFRRDFPTRDESRDGPRAVYPRAVA